MHELQNVNERKSFFFSFPVSLYPFADTLTRNFGLSLREYKYPKIWAWSQNRRETFRGEDLAPRTLEIQIHILDAFEHCSYEGKYCCYSHNVIMCFNLSLDALLILNSACTQMRFSSLFFTSLHWLASHSCRQQTMCVYICALQHHCIILHLVIISVRSEAMLIFILLFTFYSILPQCNNSTFSSFSRLVCCDFHPKEHTLLL